jgi:hypothetical protein
MRPRRPLSPADQQHNTAEPARAAGDISTAAASTASTTKAGSSARSGPASGGAPGTAASVSTSGFTMSTPAGQKVIVNEDSSTPYLKVTKSICVSAITASESILLLGRPSRPRRSSCNQRRRRICRFLGGRGGPLSSAVHRSRQAGRSDPGELHRGGRDDRQRNGGEQGDRSCAGRLPRRRRRPCRDAEPRRVRGSLPSASTSCTTSSTRTSRSSAPSSRCGGALISSERSSKPARPVAAVKRGRAI